MSSTQTSKEIKRTISPNRQLTIGFLTPGLQVDSRFYEAWVGAVEAARERSVNLVCFSVGWAYDEASLRENKHKMLFDLITSERFDGLITFEWWNPEQFKRVCSRYRPLPVVNLMQKIGDGYYSVLLSHSDVMRVKLQHLIEVHGYRRIAYLRGPEDNWQAEVQYQTYVDMLAEYGLPLDPALTVPFPPATEYTLEHYNEYGQEAIRVLLDEHRVRPGQDVEAILCYIDWMALGALEMLQQRGIRVPYDVAVVGSGGQEESRFAKPPLTTTAPPYYEMGQKAVEVLLSVLAGETVTEHTILPVGLHVRRSCGCIDPAVTRATAEMIRDGGESFEVMVAARREKILSTMEQATGGRWEHLEGWAERLLSAFVAEVVELSPESFNVTSSDVAETGELIATGFIQTGFIQTLEGILYQVDRVPGDVRIGHDVLSALRAQLLPCLSPDVDLLGQADNLWQQGRVLVHTIAQGSQRRWQAQKDRESMVLWEIGQQLTNTFDVVEVMNILAEGLPRLGIPACYLSIYENPATPLEEARLMLAYNEADAGRLADAKFSANLERSSDVQRPKGRIDLGPDGQRFRSTQLVPDEILPQNRCQSLVVESLHFGGEQIGFVAFETGPRDARTIYDILREEISSALGGALLIQERKRAEEVLLEERNILRTLIDNLPDFIYVKDTESQFIISNIALARFVGTKAPDELVGKTDFDFFPKELAAKYRTDEIALVDSDQPLIDHEEPVVDSRGNQRWVSTTKVPLHDSQGKVIGFVGIGRDITERRKAAEALAKLVTELEIVAQVSTATSTILDTMQLLQRVVDLTKDSFGLYHAHIYLLDENMQRLVLAAGAGAVGQQMVAEEWSIPLEQEQSLVAGAARTRQGVIVNNVRLTPDWLPNPLLPDTYSELAVPLIVGERVLGVLDVQADEVDYFTDNDIRIQTTLAAQVAVALENARLFERAEKEIIERKRAEMALAQQAQMLDAELERFFYVASHHLQEPLRMVTSYSQLLVKRYGDKVGAEADEFIDYVVDGATRIRDLLNDVLAYSLVATHGKPFESIDCTVLLDRVLANLAAAIEENGAVVSHDDLPVVMADGKQLAQLFENLIDNALKFRSEEPPQIHIGVEHKDRLSQEENAYWVFSIRDNGIGIELPYFERIFMIFQQLHAWGEYGGTGIGLAICKKIVERHGGRIWVESEPGKGSTFYFAIPDREEISFEES